MRSRPPPTARRLRRLLRLLSFFVLLTIGTQAGLAYALPWLAAHDCRASCPDDDDERCPCPIDCGPSCRGHAMRAIAPAPTDIRLPVPEPAEALILTIEPAPSSADPAEILHVPKRRLA